jgi:golgi SNAP receptor complex member 1
MQCLLSFVVFFLLILCSNFFRPSLKLTQKFSASDTLSRAEQGVGNGSASSSSNSSSFVNHGDVVAQQQEIQSIFVQLTELLNKKLQPTAVTPPQRAVTTRYHDVLQDLRADFDRATMHYQRARDRLELLGGASSSSPSSGNNTDTAAMDALLRERNHIHSSMNAVSNVLGQAEAVRSDLHSQGRSLRHTTGLIGQITSNIPGLNTIVDAIRRRRSSDDKVVAVVLALCIFFTLWYVFG